MELYNVQCFNQQGVPLPSPPRTKDEVCDILEKKKWRILAYNYGLKMLNSLNIWIRVELNAKYMLLLFQMLQRQMKKMLRLPKLVFSRYIKLAVTQAEIKVSLKAFN